MDNIFTLTPVNTVHHAEILLEEENAISSSKSTPQIVAKSPFIESNCESVSMDHLKIECITPVFARCNSVTISHYDFILALQECVANFYIGEKIMNPEIRVSHKILGRIQEALKKPKAELLPHDETIYWERIAVTIEIPSITMVVGGNTLSLVVGAVR